MKGRYMLFAGNKYYPRGGSRDFKGMYDTEEEAVKAHDPSEYEYQGGWAHVFDIKTKKMVKWFSEFEWFNGELGEYD